jgi:hypothetical protein
MCTGAVWPRRSSSASFEVADLGDDLLEPLFLATLGLDIALDLRGVLAERPVAPADEGAGEQEDEAAGEGNLLGALQAEGRTLGLAAFGRQQVDANHRSPALRSASPRATAQTGA